MMEQGTPNGTQSQHFQSFPRLSAQRSPSSRVQGFGQQGYPQKSPGIAGDAILNMMTGNTQGNTGREPVFDGRQHQPIRNDPGPSPQRGQVYRQTTPPMNANLQHQATRFQNMVRNQYIPQQPSQPKIPPQIKRNSSDSRFGLMKLVNLLNNPESDEHELVKGIDLTTLGLNLNSTGVLNSSFSNAWGKSRITPDFEILDCYTKVPNKDTSVFHKLKIQSLFYCFYSMPRDEMQMAAAKHICQRGWLYHKTLQTWFKKIESAEYEEGKDSIHGQFETFSVEEWKVITEKSPRSIPRSEIYTC